MNFFPLNVLNVSSNRLPEERQSHIVCICVTFIHCVFANVPSDRLLERMHFPSVYFQMSPQIACMWESLVALLAFVWFVSSVRFQMSPKIAYMRWCKVTLVAFVRLFSTVHFQMSLVYCLCQTETMRIANQKRWQMKVKVWSTCKFCPLKFQIIIPPKSLFFRPTKIFVLPRQNQSIPSNSIFPHFRIWRNHPPTFRKKSWKLGE